MNRTIQPTHFEKLDEVNFTVDENKRNIWLLILFFIIRIPIHLIISLDPERAHWEFVGLFLAFYIVVAMLIWNNRRNLMSFHLDKLSLFLFLVFSTVFRVRVLDSLITFSLELIIFLCVVIFGIMLFRSKIKFETFKVVNRWNGLAILFGFSFAIVKVIINQHTRFGSVFDQFLFVSTFNYGMNIVVAMGSTVMIEEPIYRGFLWGTLRNLNWQENQILIFQGFMFWISHLYYWNQPMTLWVALPIMCLLLGFLAKKSKSIIPSVIVHAIYNAA